MTCKSKSLKHCPEGDETMRTGTEIIKNPDGKWTHYSCHKELNSDKTKN